MRIVGVHEEPLSANSDLQHWCRYVILDPTPIQVTFKYDVAFWGIFYVCTYLQYQKFEIDLVKTCNRKTVVKNLELKIETLYADKKRY